MVLAVSLGRSGDLDLILFVVSLWVRGSVYGGGFVTRTRVLSSPLTESLQVRGSVRDIGSLRWCGSVLDVGSIRFCGAVRDYVSIVLDGSIISSVSITGLGTVLGVG